MFPYERSLEHHLVFVNRQNGSSEEKKLGSRKILYRNN